MDAGTTPQHPSAPPATTRPDAARPDAGARAAAGKAVRRRLPLAALAADDPGATRPDPVTLLEQQAASRLPDLVPLRYRRMLASPFAFYRGAALGMAHDLASGPSSGLRVQLCGDAHLSNFGVYGSAERRLVFDLNDFDETLPGPFEWDVKRMVASFEIAGRDRGFAAADRAAIVRLAAASYRLAMRDFAGRPALDVWYARADMDELMSQAARWLAPRGQRRTAQALAKARRRDSSHAFDRLVTTAGGAPTIVSDPPWVVPIEDMYPDHDASAGYGHLRRVLQSYRRTLEPDRRHLVEGYTLVGAAHKVVGVGSVGTRAWILLLTGNDTGEPLFLQAKQAQASVLESFAGRSRAGQHGRRVVLGQRLMQASSDIFLGWTRSGDGTDGIDYYVRQLRDWKGSVDISQLEPAGMTAYARLCGWTLARAHARSGDKVAIAAYLGRKDAFDTALAEFAVSCADRNERDHAALAQAVREGRVVAAAEG
ncbi:MAG: DUF2252 domain-containing protein [Actinobacteria bacterium]|nr:DUF2252 domain-containing protein [Actinomycetota bacterium]MCG2802178.1 DUF2252 domain-containing protein [Cellulomonas sp.]